MLLNESKIEKTLHRKSNFVLFSYIAYYLRDSFSLYWHTHIVSLRQYRFFFGILYRNWMRSYCGKHHYPH